MSEFIFWTECERYHRFDPYGFLQDDFFDESRKNSGIGLYIRGIPPHEVYQETFEWVSGARGCGKKTTAKVVEIIEKYRRNNLKHFCECGEPYLHWYKFCPECGKERKA